MTYTDWAALVLDVGGAGTAFGGAILTEHSPHKKEAVITTSTPTRAVSRAIWSGLDLLIISSANLTESVASWVVAESIELSDTSVFIFLYQNIFVVFYSNCLILRPESNKLS